MGVLIAAFRSTANISRVESHAKLGKMSDIVENGLWNIFSGRPQMSRKNDKDKIARYFLWTLNSPRFLNLGQFLETVNLHNAYNDFRTQRFPINSGRKRWKVQGSESKSPVMYFFHSWKQPTDF